jgi:hypothetical protein
MKTTMLAVQAKNSKKIRMGVMFKKWLVAGAKLALLREGASAK